MTSVPLGFWPDNVSSLAWVIICIALIFGSALNEISIFGIEWRIIVANIIIGCLGIFVIDQVILGPLYYCINKKR